MLTVTVILPRGPRSEERANVVGVAGALRGAGHMVTALESGALRTSARIVRSRDDVFDFQGARASLLAWMPRFLKPSARTVCTLHDPEEFRPGLSVVGRMRARLGTWVAVHCAHELVTTQKLLQYRVFRQYGRLPTYIPQGVSRRQHDARSPRGIRGLRRHAYCVVILSGGETQVLGRLPRFLRDARLPRKLVVLTTDHPARVVKTTRTRRPMLPWEHPARDAVLKNAAVLLALTPLRFPAVLRHAALAGRPLLALDIPEHREALHERAVFVPSATPAYIREGLRVLAARRRSLERRAAATAEWIERLYAWDVIVREILGVYRRGARQRVPLDSLTPRVSPSQT